jgi:hypothetical protein
VIVTFAVMMTQEASTTDKNIKKAQTLLQQGYIAYNNWEIKKARLLWRKAAVVDPANEEVWMALYNVTQDDEDRKVCLQNILVLNPDNAEAEQRLRLIENETQPADVPVLEPQVERVRPLISDEVRRVFSWILSALLVITVAIVLFSILIQPLV